MVKPKKPSPKELYWARKHQEDAEKVALLPPGLVNHGNTCFMNSVLQGLVATQLLEELVLFRLPSQRFVQSSASRCSPLIVNGRGSEGIHQEWVRGMSLGDVFLATLERAWRMREAKDRSGMSPKELLTRLGQKYDQYMDFRQQDAHEFFLHLLDGIRMEEFDIIKHRQPKPSPKSSKRRVRDISVAGRLPDVIPEEDRLVSFVDVLWGGRFTSVLICETCKHVSHTYEDFDDLSLSITHDESKERKRDRLRAFASRFISQSSRSRDPSPRPQSASQPPSPSLPTTSLEPIEDALEPPRRRSFEADSLRVPSPEPTAEKHKLEILAGFRNSVDEKDSAAQQSVLRSQKANDVGLGSLGRRLSVNMSLGPRKERKSGRTDKDPRHMKTETTGLTGKSNESYDGISFSPAGSKPASRQPSPLPWKILKGPTKIPNPRGQDALEAAYLRRLLEDTTPNLSNPFAMLRMTSFNGSSSAWSKISSTQGVEECLKKFTAVEALDGDNMFGCRNCWKIANGQAPRKATFHSEEESDDSSHGSGSGSLDPGQSFSKPDLSPLLSENHSASSISTSLMSSTLELNLSTSASSSSLAMKPRLSGSWSQGNLVGLEVQDNRLSNYLAVTENRTQEIPIPTIATISPPPDSSTSDSPEHHLQYRNLSSGGAARASLGLPEVRLRHRPDSHRDRESSVSSDDSGHYETSGASDGDGSLSTVPQSVDTRHPRRSSLARSRQVIYRRALKRYLIARPPPILVIHLKRFQQVSRSPITLFGNLKKLDDYVSFPEYLDIRPFLAPKKEDYGLGKDQLRGKVLEKGKREEDQPCVYRLYSVVVHIGNMLGGHYIAYTALPPSEDCARSLSKDNPASQEGRPDTQSAQARQWCYISDTLVRLVSLEEVLKAKAYLCMYERIQ